MLVTGAAGAGLTTTCRVIALEAARRGIAVRVCCTTPPDAAGLSGWPNITVASTVPDMIGLIGGTFDDMMRRYEEMAAGQPADYPRTLLVIDEYTVFTMLVSAWWAQERRRQGGQLPEQHPVIRQARGLVILGRAARMNAAIATLRPAGLPVDIVNNLRHLAGAWPACRAGSTGNVRRRQRGPRYPGRCPRRGHRAQRGRPSARKGALAARAGALERSG